MSKEIYLKNILPLRSRLLGIARGMLYEEQDAEDAVQEVLLRIWLVSDSLGKYDNPQAVAVAALKNHCLDRLKKVRHEQAMAEDTDIASDSDNPYYALEHKDTEEILTDIIDKLPSLQQMIIKMKDIHNYEVDEIAHITGTTAESVRMNLSRARRRVREEYLKISER